MQHTIIDFVFIKLNNYVGGLHRVLSALTNTVSGTALTVSGESGILGTYSVVDLERKCCLGHLNETVAGTIIPIKELVRCAGFINITTAFSTLTTVFTVLTISFVERTSACWSSSRNATS